jgi:hypothetical protein
LTRRADLERTALRLTRIVGTDKCALIGGLAVAAHGYLRATEDVDLVASEPLAEVAARLKAAGVDVTLMRGDVLDGDFPCVKGHLDGVPFDVLPPLVRLEWERSEVLRLGRTPLRVVSFDGLVRLKLRAEGPQDLLDIAMLVLLHPERRESAVEAARTYRLADRVEALLANPRLQAKAAELRDAATRRRRPRRR